MQKISSYDSRHFNLTSPDENGNGNGNGNVLNQASLKHCKIALAFSGSDIRRMSGGRLGG